MPTPKAPHVFYVNGTCRPMVVVDQIPIYVKNLNSAYLLILSINAVRPIKLEWFKGIRLKPSLEKAGIVDRSIAP